MSTLKTQTIQPPSDSDGLTFRTNQSDRVTIGADGFVRISNGTVTGGITLNGTLNLIGGITASGGATFGGGLRINDSTASSSTSTGALVVSGGVGVGGALNVASTGNFSGLLTLAGATSAAVISCATAPTQGQHLTNKSYVDGLVPVTATSSTTRVGSFVFGTHNLYSNITHISNSAVSFNPPTASTQYGTLTFPSGQSWSGGGIAMNNNAAANTGFIINTSGTSNTVTVDYYTTTGNNKGMMFFAYRTA